MQAETNPLGYRPIGTLLGTFAVPSIISMVVSTLYNIVEQMAAICSTIVMGAGTLLFQLFPDAIVSIFGSESDLYREFAVKSLKIFLLLILLNGFQLCAGTFFQAIGKPLPATLISLSRSSRRFTSPSFSQEELPPQPRPRPFWRRAVPTSSVWAGPSSKIPTGQIPFDDPPYQERRLVCCKRLPNAFLCGWATEELILLRIFIQPLTFPWGGRIISKTSRRCDHAPLHIFRQNEPSYVR